MSTPSDEEARSRLISDAVKLAVDLSDEGARTLAAFLDDVGPQAATKVAEHLKTMPSRELTVSSGKLASEALTVALDLADAAKEGLDQQPGLRDRTVRTTSELLSFLGSMFIDTANNAVGVGAGQLVNRARVVNVDVPKSGSKRASVWVVNRGADEVTGTPVSVIGEPGRVEITPDEQALTIGTRGRVKITLTVQDLSGQVGSESYALLVVEGLGSIVIHAKVV